MIALSCIVVVCTVYALSLPAQTLACDKEEHTHTAECYDENNELICEKEEHTHTDDCNKQEEVNEQEEVVKDEPEIQNKDEQVSQESEEETTTTTETTTEPFDLNNSVGKIESIVITDDKNNSSIPGGTLSPNSKFLKITVNFKDINASELNSKYGRSFSYTLPKFFRMTGNTNTTIKDKSNIVIATIRVEDRKVVITYTEKYINSGTNTSLNGDFFVEGEVDLSQLNKNDGKTILTTPKGDITLDYGQDYLEKFGDVEVKKAYSKPDPKSDYIQYTITVSSQNGSKNVYVVDKFTNNSQLVSYMGDISNTPQVLASSPDGQKPYEERTKSNIAGNIYLTDMQTSDDEIPKQVTDSSSINQPGSLVWSISELKPNESRTLTYFVKLSDDKNLNKQSITNIASAYTKKEGGTTYPKGKDVKTYTPNIYYNMPKTMVEKTKDDDGNYIVKYKLEFTLNSSSDYPLKNFMFYDYLNYHNIRTDEKMLPYISYERDTVKLYQTKDGKDTLVDPSNYKVEWETDGTNYKADWSNSDGNPKRFRIRGTDPFTVYPGDSYYVTYKLKVKPEVYAAMQSNNVTINNRYIANADNAKEFDDTILNRTYGQLKLEDYKWVDKKKEATVTNQVQTINMGDSDIYVKKNDSYVKYSSVNSFKVPAGSYKYTVNVNQTMNQFDVTEATLKDTLSSDVMHYVGYVKITPYKYDATKNVYENQKPKWVKIDNETSFELKLSQIGWTNNNNSYRFDYYAQTNDLSEVGKVEVKNTFSLSGDVVKGNQTFKFNNVGSSQTIQVNGHYSLSVNKSAWYYEKPQENATSYANGKLYWVIEVSGSAIRKDTQIQDAISKDTGLKDSFLHSDSIVGIYQGKAGKNVNLYASFEDFKNSNKGLVDKSKSFDQKFDNSKNFSGTDVYSELTLTANETISLNNDASKLYIVIMTEPQSLPSAYRAEFTYRNVALMKDISDQSFIERSSASQILYGGPNILKELGQTFTYDGEKVTTIQADHDKDNPGSKICTDLLNKTNSKGAFISWAFKVNLAGELEGNYRVLEDIPNGMELSYIRVKWHADEAGDVKSKNIDGLGAEWEPNRNDSTNDNGNPEKTIYYYNKNTNQALIQLGEFEAGRVGDKYAVDVQVVCRITDDKVLLGGEEKSFTNKVTLLSPDGQTIIDTASNEATMSKRDNLSKSDDFDRKLVEKNTSQTINYTITANALGQTLPLNDGNKLTLVDKLDENLELDPTTIKAKEDNGNEVHIDDKSYDPKTNTLEISIPNGKKVIITYSVTVKAAPGIPVDLSNKVFWKSYSENGGENDVIKGFKYRLAAGGSTEGERNPQLTITKMDENKLEPIKDVKFDVYECELNGEKIQRVLSRGKISGKTDANGIYKVDSSFITHSNRIYEVKETDTPDGYVENKEPYYIIYVEKVDGVNPQDVQDCIDYFNKQDKVRYKIVDSPQKFNLVVYNTQEGITVKKEFTNNAAETKYNPISGTYRFGLYANADGTGTPLEIISIHYDPKDKDVKSAKFKNPIDLTKDYYVFEIGQNNQPIKASDDEATINSMQYKVVYKNETDSTKTNNAKVGETVIVTNKSRTKILPSTGSIGTLIYRLLGATLVVASLICLSNINKNNRKEKRRKR